MSTRFESDLTANEPAVRSSSLGEWLQRFPVWVRMSLYVPFFLGALFGGLAGINYQIDHFLPAIHFEIGSWRFVGVGIFGIALIGYLATVVILTKRGDGAFAEFDPPSRLVQSGPYAWVRNPISICVVTMNLGEAIALSSTGVLLMFFVGIGIARVHARKLEEPRLTKRFGHRYLDYQARVHRWIPRRPSVS